MRSAMRQNAKWAKVLLDTGDLLLQTRALCVGEVFLRRRRP